MNTIYTAAGTLMNNNIYINLSLKLVTDSVVLYIIAFMIFAKFLRYAIHTAEVVVTVCVFIVYISSCSCNIQVSVSTRYAVLLILSAVCTMQLGSLLILCKLFAPFAVTLMHSVYYIGP